MLLMLEQEYDFYLYPNIKYLLADSLKFAIRVINL